MTIKLKLIEKLNFEEKNIFKSEDIDFSNINLSLISERAPNDIVLKRSILDYYESNKNDEGKKLKFAFCLDFIKNSERLNSLYVKDVKMLQKHVEYSFNKKCSDNLKIVLNDNQNFLDKINFKFKSSRSKKNIFIDTVNNFYDDINELATINSFADNYFDYVFSPDNLTSRLNGKIFNESLRYYDESNSNCKNISEIGTPQRDVFTIQNSGISISNYNNIFYYNKSETFSNNSENYLYLDSDYLFSSILFNSITSISSINPNLLLTIAGENKSFNDVVNFFNGYYINNKEKIIYTSPNSSVNFMDYISNNFSFNYNKFVDENSDIAITNSQTFKDYFFYVVPKNYLNFYSNYRWFNIFDEYVSVLAKNNNFLNTIYSNFSFNPGSINTKTSVASDVSLDVRKISRLNRIALNNIINRNLSQSLTIRSNRLSESSTISVSDFWQDFQTSIFGEEDNYYHYSKNEISNTLNTVFENINFSRRLGAVRDNGVTKENINNGFYEELINDSFLKILYKSKKITSDIKIKKLQKNNISYDFFKSSLASAKNNNQDDNTLNAYTVEDENKVSLVDKNNYFFNLLFSKEDQNNYISNNNYTSERKVENIKIKNSLNNVFQEIKNTNDIESIKDEYYSFLSEFYFKSYFNSSFNLLTEILNDIQKEINSNIDSARYRKYSVLQFLYMSCFENEIKLEEKYKKVIAKRLLLKTISKKGNTNGTLFNAKNGFSLNKENVNIENYEKSSAGQERYISDLFESNEDLKLIKNSVFKKNKNNKNINEFLSLKNIKKRKYCYFPFVNKTEDGFDVLGDLRKLEQNIRINKLDYILEKLNDSLDIKNSIRNIKIQYNENEDIIEFESSNLKFSFLLSCGDYEIASTVIEDNFDEIFEESEDSDEFLFKSILNKIENILKLTTNYDDVYFENISQMNGFLEENNFVYEYVINMLEVYADLYNIYFRRLHDIIMLKNSFFNEEIERNVLVNDVYIDKGIREYAFKDFIDIKDYYVNSYNDLDLGNALRHYPDYRGTSPYDFSNFINNLNSLYNNNSYTMYSYNIYNQLTLLKSEAMLQSFNFDILGSFITSTLNNVNKINNKKEILKGIENFYGKNITNILSDNYELNVTSKEIYSKLEQQENFNCNNSTFFTSNNADIITMYLKNNTFNLYKGNFDIKKSEIDKINNNQFYLNHINGYKILCFALPMDVAKNISFESIIKIKVSKYNHNSPAEEDADIDNTHFFYFSPLLTSYTDSHSHTDLRRENIGKIGIYNLDKKLKNRFSLINNSNSSEILNNLRTNSAFSGRSLRLLRNLVNNHLLSSGIENFCKNIFLNNINKYALKESHNDNFAEKELIDMFLNSYDEIQFRRKFGEDFSKEKFEELISNSNVIDGHYQLKNLDYSINNNTYVVESIKNIYDQTSENCIKNIFNSKKYYDIYYFPINSSVEDSNIVFEIDII